MSRKNVLTTTCISDFAYEKQEKVYNNGRNAFEGVEIKPISRGVTAQHDS